MRRYSHNQPTRWRRGSLSAVAMLTLAVGALLALAMISIATGSYMNGQRQRKQTAVQNLAQAGLQYGYWKFAYGHVALPYTDSNHALGPGTVTVSVVDNSAAAASTLKITSTATVDGVSLTVTGVFPKAGITVSGTVFEDVNYGGGAGRSLAASGGTPVPGATLEVYDATGSYLWSAMTDSGGAYIFRALAPGTSYTIRCVSGTVATQRAANGGASSSGLPGVQTYRTDATSGAASAVADHVGGQSPQLVDAGKGTVGTTLTSLTTASAAPQCVTTVSASANLAGVDFGFNFDTVVNKNDTGQGSLRQAMLNANALTNSGLAQSGKTAGIENVLFMIPDGAAHAGMNTGMTSQFTGTPAVATINYASSAPFLTDPIVLDATTLPNFNATTCQPLIEINGAGAPGTAGGAFSAGLIIATNGCTIRGFIINRFNADAGADGVDIYNGSNNTVQGCYLGTSAAGTAASTNGGSGIWIYASSGNQIGGTTTAARNVISGNGVYGVCFDSASGSQLQGNYIGTNAAGTAAIPNGGGVILTNTTSETIGGTTTGAGNVICGNVNYGIWLNGTIDGAVSGTVVRGNSIGVGATGGALGNGSGVTGNNYAAGIMLSSANGNTIGGSAGGGNLISANYYDGIGLINSTGNVIQGNYIGTDSTGASALANSYSGIYLSQCSSANTIGGSTSPPSTLTGSGQGNVISANQTTGVYDWNSTGTVIRGNYIGVGITGAALGNGANGSDHGDGIVCDATTNTVIGGSGSGNVVSSNAWDGVGVFSSSGVTIQGNYIGTDPSGTAARGNIYSGIFLSSSNSSTVGGASLPASSLLGSGLGNVLSGNGTAGIYVFFGSGNTILGNSIGLGATGAALGNGATGSPFAGVGLNGCSSAYLGRSASGAGIGNVISGNSKYGISIDTATVTIQGNYIGTTATGTTARANGSDGIHATGCGSGLIIGGASAPPTTISGSGLGNVISGNGGHGVYLTNGTGSTIQGNYIGTTPAGTAALGNTGVGVVGTSGSGLTIGGASSGAANLIGSNTGGGISLTGISSPTIQANYIGVNSAGTNLANGSSGIYFGTGCPSAQILSNTIWYSAHQGITICDASTSSTANTKDTIKYNGIANCTGLGIDLGNTGAVRTNGGVVYSTSGSVYANSGMNYATFTAASLSGTTLTVSGYVGTSPGQAAFSGATVQVFLSDGSGFGYGSGKTYLGQLTANSSGQFSGVALTGMPATVTSTKKITATATDSLGNTSEFGPNFTIP